jgi:hypothetical protein
MSSRDKLGLAILISIFLLFGAVLVSSWPRSTDARKLEDNVIVQQRMKNLEKSR